MKSHVFLCLGLILLVSCSHPSWHRTSEGVYIYCIAKDKYNLSWKGGVAGCLANGNGQLISYDKDGEIKEYQTINTKLGVADGWNYLPCKGYYYLGELDDELPNGFGVLMRGDTLSIGEYKDSHLYKGYCEEYIIKEQKVLPVFAGMYKKGKTEGVVRCYEDGLLTFEGSMHKGKRKGMGKEYAQGIILYEGAFEKDLRNGYGKAYKNGTIWYDGHWKKGKRDGDGNLYNENGLLIYSGEWDDDLYDGKGKLYENGICTEGKWDKGKLTKSISSSVVDQVIHATQIWLNNDSIKETPLEENNPIPMATSQMEFVDQLQNDIETTLKEEFTNRVDKRFGFWHLLRMLIQPWTTSDVKRARNAQDFFCKNIDAKEIQQLINTKIDYYNRYTTPEEKLNYVKIAKLPDGAIVDTDVALKIFDREAMETTDTLVGIILDIVITIVVAFVIGFILGYILGEEALLIAGIINIILSLIAVGIGLYISIFKTSAISIELENQIVDMLINNYMQYLDSHNIIIQMLGLL